ncbi:MAG: AHH domain-containing protein, partial [Phycisphaerales bacterium]|nr:AHH domain-containing protein [Phycisphaerales bacterium]
LNRWTAADPNAMGVPVLMGLWWGGGAPRPPSADVDLADHYVDGINVHAAFGSDPVSKKDPSGLFVGAVIGAAVQLLPGPSDFISGALESLVGEYAARQEYDLGWASDWEAGDDWHSRLDSKWVTLAIGRGLHGAFEVSVPGTDWSFNPLGPMAGDAGGSGPAMSAMVTGGRFSAATRRMFAGMGKLHHIATVYGDWGSKFQRVFKSAGVEINDAINALPLKVHRGPHAASYHQEILDRLKAAVRRGGSSPKLRNQYFMQEMVSIRRDFAAGKFAHYDLRD